jgi:E3 ubiquitin-protein ligase TRIP12
MSTTLKPTNILHRTPWQPPVAVGGQGIYLDLDNGQKLIDAVGGAAVACIGNGHPDILKAIKDQVDKLSCEYFYKELRIPKTQSIADVYNMQLSNEPAEELASLMIANSKGVFSKIGFVSGGMST